MTIRFLKDHMQYVKGQVITDNPHANYLVRCGVAELHDTEEPEPEQPAPDSDPQPEEPAQEPITEPEPEETGTQEPPAPEKQENPHKRPEKPIIKDGKHQRKHGN